MMPASPGYCHVTTQALRGRSVAFHPSIIGKAFGPDPYKVDWQRASLYALACGAGTDELDLILESRGPKVLPAFAVTIARNPILEAIVSFGGSMLTLVHGGQRCVFHRPIPSQGTLLTTAKATALYDKGKAAVGIFESSTVTEGGDPVFDTEWQIFYRGEGGFGGERGKDAPEYKPPEGKAPDHRFEMSTLDTQALIYRLASQDMNPIHSDPEIAKKAGFPKPILHGLCTFGHATRAAVLGACRGDPDRLKSIEGRFTKPVFPGDTIVTEVWTMSSEEAYFTTSVKERAEAVITLGRVTFRSS